MLIVAVVIFTGLRHTFTHAPARCAVAMAAARGMLSMSAQAAGSCQRFSGAQLLIVAVELHSSLRSVRCAVHVSMHPASMLFALRALFTLSALFVLRALCALCAPIRLLLRLYASGCAALHIRLCASGDA